MSDGQDGRANGRPPDGTRITPEHDDLLLDVMLGKLATYLRMCGYDAVYALDEGIEADDAVQRRAAADARRLLTRDRELAASTPGSILLTARDVTDQLRELREAGVDLTLAARPARCGACNGSVDSLPPDCDRPEYAPDEGPVWRCRDCGQCFWKGSHWDDVAATLADL
ncbi:Mut7-C RNAse domain-containing protein [Halobaculum limi]|uniref:Mut7-C RNAse domain-containing protein n=1 Tax=Halobaculum limi TaxID=3031916 RepID=UPI0024074FAF|nr:Mut7-C RNAse domain-containing protein [Halobaculum sp. YSMS11]